MSDFDVAAIRQGIAKKYREAAVSPAGLFTYPTGAESALGLDYSSRLVGAVPPAVRSRFVGVGNPLALGPIRPGEAVLDLGCGAGFDAIIAAFVVGPAGRVVGIDISPEMLAIAETGRAEARLTNVGFGEAAVEALPFSNDSFDVALSNGVLNLVPDKPAALAEIFRVLRPGGRLQTCDMGLAGEGPRPERSPWSD